MEGREATHQPAYPGLFLYWTPRCHEYGKAVQSQREHTSLAGNIRTSVDETGNAHVLVGNVEDAKRAKQHAHEHVKDVDGKEEQVNRFLHVRLGVFGFINHGLVGHGSLNDVCPYESGEPALHAGQDYHYPGTALWLLAELSNSQPLRPKSAVASFTSRRPRPTSIAAPGKMCNRPWTSERDCAG